MRRRIHRRTDRAAARPRQRVAARRDRAGNALPPECHNGVVSKPGGWFSWSGSGRRCRGSAAEGSKGGQEDGVEEVGVFDAGGADGFAEFVAAQAGSADVLGAHAGYDAHVEEFGGDDAGLQGRCEPLP